MFSERLNRMALEILFLVCTALFFTRGFLTDKTLPGREAEWLTSSVYFAAQSLHEDGRIPLWQPYLEYGEPLLESPFSFVLNPVSSVPSLLFGARWGLNLSVILYAILAAVGGWYMGRVMGLGMPGRVLLGLLLLGKGNMHVMIGMGYFQLGVAQAYFPWIMGGVIASLKFPEKRAPVVMTAAAFALLFLAGNIWYTLPMLLSMALVVILYITYQPPTNTDNSRTARYGVNLRRLILAGLFTLGLSAVALLPIWMNRAYIGGHPDADLSKEAEDVLHVAAGFWNGSREPFAVGSAPGDPQFFYTFVVPRWFVLLIMVIPLGWMRIRDQWRLALAGILLAGFFTLWGAGQVGWFYEHVPGLGQWRFVGRALAAASFWIAVLVALRVDRLWRSLGSLLSIDEQRKSWGSNFLMSLLAHHKDENHTPFQWGGRKGAVILAARTFFLLITLYAVSQVVGQWRDSWRDEPDTIFTDPPDAVCLAWLREQYPTAYLNVWRFGYDGVYPFLDHHARLYNIEADFEVLPLPNTLSHRNTTRQLPEFGLAWGEGERTYLSSFGYEPLAGSPTVWDRHPCAYRLPNMADYAFGIGVENLQNILGVIPKEQTQSVEILEHVPDRISLRADGGEVEQVIIVQELAYPGWQVSVNGERANLESAGGLLGVILPPGNQLYEITFAYRPVWLFRGAVITLLTLISCGVYGIGVGQKG